MIPIFTTEYQGILNRIQQIDPIQYNRTRNYVDGAVTYLSPYISRGVISTKQVLFEVLKKGYKLDEIETFVKELAWRDYFQRVWQHKNINEDIKSLQTNVRHHQIPRAIVEATTFVEGVDQAIVNLYNTGYMHNHCRMYTASIACNIAQSHWLKPAQWMYYHLLDGDWGSNACSWQWVAGCNSSKKYYSNQMNISTFTHTPIQDTFLLDSYETLATRSIPELLEDTIDISFKTIFPETKVMYINVVLPIFIYNYYNLDPNWHKDEAGSRILLIEPDIFEKYPISNTCMNFMIALAENIPGLQIYVGSFDSIKTNFPFTEIYYKEHPLNTHYSGIEEPREWLSETITDYFQSFFGYWKKLEKELKHKTLRYDID